MINHGKNKIKNSEKIYWVNSNAEYLPFKNEISTNLIHELLFSLGFEISFPCINDKEQNLIPEWFDLLDLFRQTLEKELERS